ncbi:hypothetical protein [Methanosarcina sp.]|uniref:hypothetical protein n=1 Tax=Methanosarcina sp. TaxID=2213 RepID=UPI003C71661F
MSYLQDEFNKFLNAESCYFNQKELLERKERAVQLFLIIFGLILSYSWKSDILDGALPLLFFVFIASILLYYSILPSSFVNGEFRTIIRGLAIIIAVVFSSALILVFSSIITEYSGSILLVLFLMLASVFALILRLFYV